MTVMSSARLRLHETLAFASLMTEMNNNNLRSQMNPALVLVVLLLTLHSFPASCLPHTDAVGDPLVMYMENICFAVVFRSSK